MRHDMAKVIVERPRWGSRLKSRKKGYRKYLQKSDIADLPRREPLPGRWRGLQRCFSEHLGPLERFLRSNIGRPWNKVHQELSQYVSFDNVVQKHILTHVYDFVVLHVAVVRGELVRAHRWERKLGPGQMYVCPRTGLLRATPRTKRRRAKLFPHVAG